LKGEEIPLSARILTVADVFDVLTSRRPYKDAMTLNEARERLLEGSARSFDPMIIQAFLNLLDDRPDFIIPQRDGQAAPLDADAQDAINRISARPSLISVLHPR
jgi:putative two-component system response regulator